VAAAAASVAVAALAAVGRPTNDCASRLSL
jgi:hypothetical protein